MSYVTPITVIAVGSVFPALGIVAVALRFYTRREQKAPLMIDDWLIIPALLTMIGLGVCMIVGSAKGSLGYPTPPAGPEGELYAISPQTVLSSKIEWIMFILQPASLGFAKLSIVFFYRRIFCVGKPGFLDYLTRVVIVAIILWALSFILGIVFVCGTHPALVWGRFIYIIENCINTTALDEAYAISDFILDIVILCMPLPRIWKLHMPMRRRIAVSIVFATGALTVVVAGVRVAILLLLEHGIFTSVESSDRDLSTAIFLYWTMLEAGLAVIVACLPTFRSLLGNVSPKALGRSIRSKLSLSLLHTQHSAARSGKSESLHENSVSVPIVSKDTGVESYVTTHVPQDLEAQYIVLPGNISVRSDLHQQTRSLT